MNGNPIPLRVAISVISGVKIHPPKKPFRNLAKISSSDRFLISAFERMIERESVISLWCLGLTIELRELEDKVEGVRFSDMCIVRVLDRERGAL